LTYTTTAKVARGDRVKNTTIEGNQHKNLFIKGTRINTLMDIENWLENGPQQVYSLLDVAGMGKSTVTKHLETKWRHERHLVARFFFSRNTTETMSNTLFCSAISTQLVKSSEEFAECLERCKEEYRKEKRNFDESIEEMFEALIVNPLKKFDQPVILVIDALDECDNGDGFGNGGRDRLLKTLKAHLLSLPKLRILTTGRPLPDIKKTLTNPNIRITNFRETEGYNDDIAIYVNARLSESDEEAFSDEIKQRVTNMAAGHFIWARIACDLLIRTYDRDSLLESFQKEISDDDRLNQLYRIAMRESTPADNASKRAVAMILQVFFAAQEPLSIEQLERLSPHPQSTEKVIAALGSLLIFEDRTSPIRPLHLTFREFIVSKDLSGDYYVPLELGHRTVALKCVETLRSEPKLVTSGSKW
jgi:hypothetical protein